MDTRRRGPIGAWALLAVALLASCGGPPAGPSGSAPAFSAGTPDGRRVSLADYRGHIVMLNFWATWCVPCRTEIPDLQHEYATHRAEGLVVLGVDYKEPAADVSAFVDEIGVTFPMLLDPDGRIHDAYHVGALPQTFVIDARGRITASRTGAASRQTMEEQWRAALGSSPGDRPSG